MVTNALDDCEHGGQVGVCPTCTPNPSDRLEVLFFVEAAFPHHCPACGFSIFAGDRMASLSDGQYVHRECRPGGESSPIR